MNSATRDLDELNDLLARLNDAPSENRRLLIEHLEGARFYLPGARPAEFATNIQLAGQSLDSLEDESLKARIQDFINAHR